MSGTELGRLMSEVTAQPPVDVDFGAVEHLVRRRRARTGAFAGTAAVAAVALIVAVPLLFPGPATLTAQKTAPPNPAAPAPSVDPTWVRGSWGEFTWRQPPRWEVVDTGLGNHSRPSNAGVEGPFLTTVTLGKGCYSTGANSGACDRQHVLNHIPADGVVAELVGSFDNYPSSLTQPADPGTLVAPDATCTAWGGAASLTARRTFGPADASHELDIVGCLGSRVVASGAADLRAMLASVVDSSFNAVPGPGKTVSAGDLSWQVPSTWSSGGSTGRRFVPFCQAASAAAPQSTRSYECDSGPLGSLADGSAMGWFSALDGTDDPAKSRSDYPQGQTTTPTAACKSAGGAATFTDERHLGPVDSGEYLTLTGCVTTRDQESQVSELRGIVNSAVDRQYPDPRTLCSSVPGTVESAVLATIGGARILHWGTAEPARDAFPRASADDYAAWCWVRDNAAQKFHVWLADKVDPALKVVDVGLPIFSWNPAPSVAPISLIQSANDTLGPSPTPASSAAASPTPSLTPAAATGVASGTTAAALCHSALGTFATATLTTIAEIHSIEGGPVTPDNPNAYDFPNVFKDAPSTDAAAWCWKKTTDGNGYEAWAVHLGDPPYQTHDKYLGLNEPPPSGAPGAA